MKKYLLFLIFSMGIYLLSHSATILPFKSSWKYLDNNSIPGTTLTPWYSIGFDDAAWAGGNGQLGYGDGDESTVLSYGLDANNKYITTYFRKSFTLSSLDLDYTLSVFRDDGIVVYVNGVEVFRNNMPTGTISHSTFASTAASDDGYTQINTTLSASYFIQGTNVIAVEIHQSALNSSDISFDLQLVGNTGYTITRGPYIQRGGASSAIIRYLTSSSVLTSLHYGTDPNNLINSVTELAATSDHQINLTGLESNTKYFYAIKAGATLIEGGTLNYLITAPSESTEKELNILATGDCGTGYAEQRQALNAYMNYMGSKHTDVWMLVGDNAYDNGLETEYQSKFFDVYRDSLLKNVYLYPAPGNHDYANNATRQNDHNIPYYSIFNLPTNAELGGVASGTEAYYSYNYGNAHFISLDSYGKESNTYRLYDTLNPQVVWLKADLAANTKPWTIVYFHHPPYTMGSHNSDTETELINMRQNLIRILERYKVDLLICGHSHSYERSYLLKGHYGLETTFNMATHGVSSSSAKYDGSGNSCPYVKNSPGKDFGTVYVVSGSAGKIGATQAAFPHNAMYYSNSSIAGVTAISIKGNRLDAKFISASGTILDKFTMMKNVGNKITAQQNAGETKTLSASWNGTYNWNQGGLTTQSITVTPQTSSTYYVSDNENCLRDTFEITVSSPLTISVASSPALLCAGNSFSQDYTKTGTYGAGNIFTAQLSDASGSFANPLAIGSFASTESGTISCTIPSNTPSGSGYKIRIVSSNPQAISNASSTININQYANAGLSISPSTAGSIYANTNVTFTASPIGGGSAPSFQWKKNGQNVGTNSITYSNNVWADGDIIQCQMTSNAPCVNGSPTASNSIVLSVNAAPAINYLITDIIQNKVFYYDSSFTFISSGSLSTTILNGTTNVSDVSVSGSYVYLLDQVNKRIYRSSSAGVVAVQSKTLLTNSGSALGTPTGLAIRTDSLYVLDKKNKAIYRYSLSAAFSGTGNLNALSKISLNTKNSAGESLVADGTYLYVLDNGTKKYIYRYPKAGGTAVLSKVMYNSNGTALGSLTAFVIHNGWVRIADNTLDRVFSFSLLSFFSGAGTQNANKSESLHISNTNTTGIAITNTSGLLRVSDDEQLTSQSEGVISLNVFPNPSNGNFHVKIFGKLDFGGIIRILDMTGRILLEKNMDPSNNESTEETFNLGDFPKGIYTLHVESSGKISLNSRICIQ